MATYSDNPQSDPQFTALSDFQVLPRLEMHLVPPAFVAIVLGVKIHGRSDIAMPQHALNRLRIDLPLVHEPGAEAVPEVVKTEALPLREYDAALTAADRR